MHSHSLSHAIFPTEQQTLEDMARALTSGARQGMVDLADERSTDACLMGEGYSRVDLKYLSAIAVDRARAALQAVHRMAAPVADAAGLMLVTGVWMVAYVGLVRA